MFGINNSSFNIFSIGRASDYAKSFINSLKASGALGTSKTSSSSSYLDTIANTTKSNSLFTTQNTANLSRLKSASSSLAQAANKLTTGQSALVSSDSKVVSSDTALFSHSDMSFDVEVNNLASGQVSQSAEMKSNQISSFDTGRNSMRLVTEEGAFDVTFHVGENDTNESVLIAAAKSINSAKAGVTATVVNENGKSSLKLTSDATGENAEFALESLNGSTATEKLGMKTTQNAQDASYKINGTSYTSSENTVSIPNGRGAKMTLNGTGSATLTRGIDASSIVKAAENFASAYNAAMSHLSSGSADGAGVTKAMNLIANNRMTAMSAANYGTYASARLNSMGISIDENGKMQIDAEKLTKAVKESPSVVQNSLSGYGGLAESTRQNAEAAMRIPSAQYTNFSNMGVQNSLINALMPSTGSLFDFGL